jgi:hypothetical protein
MNASTSVNYKNKSDDEPFSTIPHKLQSTFMKGDPAVPLKGEDVEKKQGVEVFCARGAPSRRLLEATVLHATPQGSILQPRPLQALCDDRTLSADEWI